jgi:hypothetical protein
MFDMNKSDQQEGRGATARVKLGRLFRNFGAGLVFACCVPLAVQAQTYYFDGSTKRIITPQSDLQAAFDEPRGVKAPATGATISETLISDGFIRVYRLTTPTLRVPSTSPLRTSPVFREGTSPAGRLMALPGGVIIQFRPEWTTEQVSEWIANHGYTVRQKLNITGQWYILDSPAGLASLEMANTIHGSGDVVSATPNWWVQTVTR